ncbi:MAG: TRAP transporter large permease [Vannielia sp.]|uniref:TRAP transporter large permease n=1 Tax=Vannielia sp. TaxID=2813045 RepID=UPI003B8C3206
MEGLWIGMAGFGVVLLLVALQFPVGVALGLVGAVGIYLQIGYRPMVGILESTPFEFTASWSLSAIPLFLLMGSVIQRSGLAGHIYTAARIWMGRLPGGLAVATNVASAGFAAMSGSSMATSAAMARLAVPEMLRAGYDRKLATGCVASAGTLGALIPPSILMILYAIFAEVSIAKMLVAGILPGLLTLAVYVAMIMLRSHRDPTLAPGMVARASLREKFASLAPVWPLPLIFFGVLGGIYGGIVTATEAAALGVLLSLFAALLAGGFSWDLVRGALIETLGSTARIFFVAMGAIIFTKFLALTGISTTLARSFSGFADNYLLLVLAASLLFLVLGMFLDPLGVMLISLPIILPVFKAVDADLIWLGVIVVKYIEIGLLTPPVGLNVYVVKSALGGDVPLGDIFRGVTWFLACEVIIMALLIGFPEISLVLANRLGL